MSLTETAIKNFKPANKGKKYADGEGLFLFVTTNGTKSWRLRYRFMGKEQELTIGTYPSLSLFEARLKRTEARKLLISGKDPITERKETKRIAKIQSAHTFEALITEWHEINLNKWTPKHAKTILYRLKRYVIPYIGKRPVSEITVIEILEILRRIEKTGKIELCHKILQYCSSTFRLAVLTQRVKYNPCTDLKGVLKTSKVKHHPTIRIADLPDFLKKLEAYNTPQLYKLAVRMLILTFVRQGELRKAKWEYFDLEKKIWCIPAELMKMRKEHIVPLANQTIEVLNEIKKISGDSEYLFPTRNKIKHPYMNENVINNLIHDLGYKGKLVAHGFRTLASTTLNEFRFDRDVIEKQLAHEEQNQVRAAYNRAEYLQERIRMMQWWADHIDNLVNNSRIRTAA